MEGVVKFVNEEMIVFAVETDNRFTVFEFVETDHIEIVDVVSGSLETLCRPSRPRKPSCTATESLA